MGNPFVHIELTTSDVGKAKSFYKSLFDWKLKDVDMGGGQTYTMVDVGDGTGGGMFEMAGAPIAWVPYAAVKDVAKSTDKARSLGATILKEKSEVPGMGWFSIFRDPTGALIALWEPKPKEMPKKAKAKAKPRKAAKAKRKAKAPAKKKAKKKARRR
jgi:predicted enzyme related to lactoylglutathione lyase